MKSVKINIKKLGAIRDSELYIKPLMIFSGESGLGKSYAAFLVHYFYVILLTQRLKSYFSERKYDFSKILEKRKNGDLLLEVQVKDLISWINKDAIAYVGYLIGNEKLDGEVVFGIPYPNDTIRFEYAEEIVGLDNNEEVYQKVKTDDFVYRIMAGTYDATATPFVELIKAELMATIFKSYNKLRRTYLMPPSRGALMELAERPAFRSGMYHEFFDFKAALARPLSKPPVLSDELTDALFDVNDGSLKQVDGKMMYYTKAGAEMPLTAAASSIKEMAPFTLFLSKFSASDSSVLLEEPEAHLHPHRQVKVADLLACAVKEGCHLQITTHSDYLIKRLNNLIKLHLLKHRLNDSQEYNDLLQKWQIKESYVIDPSEMVAYLLERDEDGTSKIRRQDIDIDGEIPFESFYKVIEEDIELSRDIKNLC